MLDIGFDSVELIGFAAAFFNNNRFYSTSSSSLENKIRTRVIINNLYNLCYWSFFMVFVWPQDWKFINDYRQFYYCCVGINNNVFYN